MVVWWQTLLKSQHSGGTSNWIESEASLGCIRPSLPKAIEVYIRMYFKDMYNWLIF